MIVLQFLFGLVVFVISYTFLFFLLSFVGFTLHGGLITYLLFGLCLALAVFLARRVFGFVERRHLGKTAEELQEERIRQERP